MKRFGTIASRRSELRCRSLIDEKTSAKRTAPGHATGLGMATAALVSIAAAPSHAAPVATDFWVGSTTPPSPWVSPDTTTNWLSSTTPTPTTYHDGDNVQFQNQYSYSSPPATAVPNSFTVTVQGAVSPGSVLVSTDTALNPGHEYVFSGSGAIAGAGALTLNAGALNIANAGGNTYSGGTTVNSGILLVNNAGGSATGTGSVTVNPTGTLGGGGFIGGAATIASGGLLAPSANPSPPPPTTPSASTNLTFQSALTLSSGAALNYNLNLPNTPGTGGGNDLTTAKGNVNLNTNLTVGINSGASFGAGIYPLITYNTLTNNSSNFMGWNSKFLNSPANVNPGQFYNLSFANDTTHDNIDLVVAKSTTPPTLSPGNSTSFVVAANSSINNSNVNNPIAKISGNTGPGGPNVSFFLARGAQPAAKAFNIGWAPVLQQIPPLTPVFAPNGTHVALPVALGGTDVPISPNPPFQTAGFPCPPCGARPPVGAIYPAGTIPVAPPPDDWLPAFRLAPLIIVNDPPAAPAPTYYGESFSIPSGFADPNGLTDVFLADEVNGEDLQPGTMDTLPDGADDRFNFQGSFLSLVQLSFPSITDLSQLDPSQWLLFDGSYGVDPANSIAWAVDDIPDANYSVVARSVVVSEPATLALLGAGLACLAFFRRRKFVAGRTRQPPHTTQAVFGMGNSPLTKVFKQEITVDFGNFLESLWHRFVRSIPTLTGRFTPSNPQVWAALRD